MSNSRWTQRICRAAAALLLLSLTAQADLGEPFGLTTVAAPDAPLSKTWQQLQPQIKADRAVIDRCRAEPKNCSSPAALQFIAIVDAGKGYETLARIGHINQAANFALRSINGATREGAPNEWTSPLAALTAGAGDCKQFSVLKYAALMDAGFAVDDVRLLILNSKARHEQHAVVGVRSEKAWLILDNRSLALAESTEVLGQYVPLYEMDQRGVRQFLAPAKVADAFPRVSCDDD